MPVSIPCQAPPAEKRDSFISVSFTLLVWENSWPTSTEAGRSSLMRARTSFAIFSSCWAEVFSDSRAALSIALLAFAAFSVSFPSFYEVLGRATGRA